MQRRGCRGEEGFVDGFNGFDGSAKAPFEGDVAHRGLAATREVEEEALDLSELLCIFGYFALYGAGVGVERDAVYCMSGGFAMDFGVSLIC